MRHYYLLILPVIAYFVIFHYIPMYGITLAFKDFKISEGILSSPFTGFDHFERLFGSPDFYQVLANTVIISLYRIIFGFPAPILLALLLNEIRHERFKRITQTISYLPYFISWVVLAGIMLELFSPNRGVVNYIVTLFGGEPIHFFAKDAYFRTLLVVTGIWQNVGWGSIIYLAAIAGIDEEQYESAYIDGANRLQIVRFITIPSISSTVAVMFILSLGGILGSGGAGGTLGNLFDQVFNLYTPAVYSTGDILDTYVYRTGLLGQQYSFSTAVGLFKNVVGFIFVITGNFIVRRITNKEYGIW